MLDTVSNGAKALWQRHEAELAALRGAGAPPGPAWLAAARVAAMAAEADEGLPEWAPVMAAEVAPDAEVLSRLWPEADPEDIARLRCLWGRIGTAEAIMETGGDIRLARDPRTGLNGYGCSHRPRPWAVTFASSTASSSSERGYAAAEAARLRATAALLRGEDDAVRRELAAIRAALAELYRLPEGGAVALAASGTDTELLALALTHLAGDQPILNILVAPEETGSGVPMAARGLHFAVDTALGHDVARAAAIEGFRADTELGSVALRAADGAARPADVVEAEIAPMVRQGLAEGKRVILHVLDLSKTGLLAPGMAFLRALRAAHGAAFDIVVDACQARLSPGSVAAYLALEAVVLVTGSKFFTGPPFAGAVLVPPAVAARLRDGRLPAGLDAYFGRDDLPDCPAAAGLPAVGNLGLALRWHAALAEIEALFAIAPARRAEILRGFAHVVAREVAANPALRLLPAPAIERGDEDWERCASIFSFSMKAPRGAAAPGEPGRCVDPDEARFVYRWLNADLSAAVPGLAAEELRLARLICHIGQPVKLPAPGGGVMGVLRVSAGARLISGEPSHRAMDDAARLAREFDDLAAVFGKLRLVLRHFGVLAAADPMPCYGQN